MSKLSKKHRQFANEYFKTGNATQSYLKYYKCLPESASASAYKVLRRQDVREYLDQLHNADVEVVVEEKVYTEREALEAETRIADVDVTEIFDENGDIRMPEHWPLRIKKAVKAVEIDRYDVIEEDSDGNKTVTSRPFVKKITFNRRGAALDRIEKCFGMQREKVEHSGQIDIRAILARIDGLNRGKLPQDCD